MKFAGIIYLHEISQTRGDVTGKDAVFDTLCRRSTIKNIIHATTKWRKPTGEEQRRREQQLSKQSWAGPHIPRFVGTQESVWAIVDLILQKDPLDTPQFREALLNLKRHLPTPKKRSNGGILAAIFGKIFAVSSLFLHCTYYLVVYSSFSERWTSVHELLTQAIFMRTWTSVHGIR